MKRLRKLSGTLALVLISLTAYSCKDNTNPDSVSKPMSNEMHQETETKDSERIMNNSQNNKATDQIIDSYLKIKNALVADNQENAAMAGGDLVAIFEDFDKSNYSSEEQQELADIIEDAKEHAEHISESPIGHQREHFDILSKDVIDMIGITGTNKKLYQDFCPMYNDNKGAQWLSATQEIRNPYMGSKMMDCGKVQKEIN
ncbi:DUF3347 domain-containing protein [Zunongwangia sp. H14]|uniref:DUF3347 domain-containing protein n=1 Tax=Zunongwangia sp. H14 TaxID=3240792 RepID=UPI0035636F16